MTLYGYARVSVREPEDKNLDLTVHPHPRGESARPIRSQTCIPGSPPPAWGKQLRRPNGVRPDRFTPTRVGKATLVNAYPYTHFGSPPPAWESSVALLNRQSRHGSPPPAWGKHVVIEHPVKRNRFTPTRVGKACYHSCGGRRGWVHPHPRGESPALDVTFSSHNGSPPPAWGKQHPNHRRDDHLRFTPTRVGKVLG